MSLIYTEEQDSRSYGMRCACDCGCQYVFSYGDPYAEQLIGVGPPVEFVRSDGVRETHPYGLPIVQLVCLTCDGVTAHEPVNR